MMWYAASILMIHEKVASTDELILVYENVVLVEAVSAEEAERKAYKIGATEASLDDGLTIDGEPAKRKFVGIRKLLIVSNPPSEESQTSRPVDGTEISYSLLRLKNQDDLKKLIDGDEVHLEYLE